MCLRKSGATMIQAARTDPIPLPWSENPPWTVHAFQNRAVNGLAQFYKPDIWHNVHLGCGKDFAASAISLLVTLCEGSNVDKRFDVFSGLYKKWCRDNKKTAYISKIDKGTVGGAGKNDEPSGSWNKAACTVTILEFIQFFCGQFREQCDQNERLRYVAAAVKSLNFFMSEMYHCDVWIPSQKSQDISRAGHHFIESYIFLAWLSGKQGEPKFPLKPKLHMVQHASERLMWESQQGSHCLNPIVESCSIDEDFVGRLAFLSRHVSARLMATRSLERYLTQVNFAWRL